MSTRRVDEIAPSMELSGISKSQVSELCKEIDERVKAFLERPLDGDRPNLLPDATYLKVREGGRIVTLPKSRRRVRYFFDFTRAS